MVADTGATLELDVILDQTIIEVTTGATGPQGPVGPQGPGGPSSAQKVPRVTLDRGRA